MLGQIIAGVIGLLILVLLLMLALRDLLYPQQPGWYCGKTSWSAVGRRRVYCSER